MTRVFGLIFLIALYECQTETTFEEQCLYSHNYVRKLHLVSNLQWDETLASTSHSYARKLAEENTLEHSENSKKGLYGENIFRGFNGFHFVKKVSEAVYYWYLEIAKYDFSNPSPDIHVVGHFTELVWRSTDFVGCGRATKEMYGGLMTYIVCQYRPGGNIESLFLLNVLPPVQRTTVPSSPEELELPTSCSDVYHSCEGWTRVCNVEIYNGILSNLCKRTCRFC